MSEKTRYWEKAIKDPSNSAYVGLEDENKYALINVNSNEIYEVGGESHLKGWRKIEEFPYKEGDKVVVVNIKNGRVVKEINTKNRITLESNSYINEIRKNAGLLNEEMSEKKIEEIIGEKNLEKIGIICDEHDNLKSKNFIKNIMPKVIPIILSKKLVTVEQVKKCGGWYKVLQTAWNNVFDKEM